MDRRIQDDGTIIVGGQVVPAGGSQPTTADVVSYNGSTNLQSTNVEAALDELDAEKAPINHTHDDRYYTEVEVTNFLAQKAAVNHTHDDRYYTEAEVTNFLAQKAAVNHAHDDRYYTEAEVDKKISAALSSTSLHANSGFENLILSTLGPGGTTVPQRLVPENWSVYWNSGSAPRPPHASIVADGSNSRNNSGFAVKVTIPQEEHEQSLDTTVFAVTPGALVRFSVWVKGNGPGVVLTILTRDGSLGDPDYFNPGTATVDGTFVLPGGNYQQITHTMTVPANHTRCRVKIRAFALSSGANASANPGDIWYDDSESSLTVIPPSGVVTGEIKMWPTTVAPSGYLLCNGGTFSSDDYPVLAALLGDRFGTHSGTTYYLPDFRARSPIGAGGAAVPAVGGNVYSIGQKYGHEKMQNHNHGGTTGGSFAEGNGYRSVPEAYYGQGYGLTVAPGYSGRPMVWTNEQGSGHGHSIPSAGTGNAENVHPVLGINFIIKAA